MSQTQNKTPPPYLCVEFLLFICLVATFSLIAYQRNLVWQDDLSLWGDVVEKSQNKARSHDYIGIAKYKNRLINDAIKHHKLAININPEYPYPYINLGICYFDKGDVNSAIAKFKCAIQLNPRNADAHYNLGIAYGSKGLYQESFQEIKIAKVLSSVGKWNLIKREMRRKYPKK